MIDPGLTPIDTDTHTDAEVPALKRAVVPTPLPTPPVKAPVPPKPATAPVVPTTAVDEAALTRRLLVQKEFEKATLTIKVISELLKELRTNRKLTIPRVGHDTGLRLKLIEDAEKAVASAASMVVTTRLIVYYQVSMADFYKEVESRVSLSSFLGNTLPAKMSYVR